MKSSYFIILGISLIFLMSYQTYSVYGDQSNGSNNTMNTGPNNNQLAQDTTMDNSFNPSLPTPSLNNSNNGFNPNNILGSSGQVTVFDPSTTAQQIAQDTGRGVLVITTVGIDDVFGTNDNIINNNNNLINNQQNDFLITITSSGGTPEPNTIRANNQDIVNKQVLLFPGTYQITVQQISGTNDNILRDVTRNVVFEGECPIGTIVIGEQNVCTMLFDINEAGEIQNQIGDDITSEILISDEPDINEAGEIQSEFAGKVIGNYSLNSFNKLIANDTIKFLNVTHIKPNTTISHEGLRCFEFDYYQIFDQIDCNSMIIFGKIFDTPVPIVSAKLPTAVEKGFPHPIAECGIITEDRSTMGDSGQSSIMLRNCGNWFIAYKENTTT